MKTNSSESNQNRKQSESRRMPSTCRKEMSEELNSKDSPIKQILNRIEGERSPKESFNYEEWLCVKIEEGKSILIGIDPRT